MKPPRYPWPDTPSAKGVLFFAQSMREMLEDETFESFRAFTLDTQSRIAELIGIYRDVNNQDIPAISAEPFAEELRWSLGRDPVVGDMCPNLKEIVCEQLKNKSVPTHERVASLMLLWKTVNKDYKSALESKIIEAHAKGRNIELRAAAGFYCSHLIGSGHSRKFLLRTVNDKFFSTEVRRAGPSSIKSFFSQVSSRTAKYRVYSILKRPYATAVSKMGFDLHDTSNLPPHVVEALSMREPVKRSERVVSRVHEANDEESASQSSEWLLGALAAINQLGPQNDDWRHRRERYESRPRSSSGILVTESRLNLVRTNRRRFRSSPAEFQRFTRKILTNFEERSTSRLISSFVSSSIHNSLSSVDSQLIALWSAVEVLLGNPPEGSSRISHYARSLVPCVSLRYVSRVCNSVYGSLHQQYGEKFASIIDQENQFNTESPQTKFASLVLLPENTRLRQELLNMCDRNPLALYRVFRLGKDFSTPDALNKSVKSHSERLRWQIFRIYRARNQLVHGGTKPNYIEGITQNLYEYYKECVWNIVDYARRSNGKLELDQCVAEIGLEFELYLRSVRSLTKNNVLTRDTLPIALGATPAHP